MASVSPLLRERLALNRNVSAKYHADRRQLSDTYMMMHRPQTAPKPRDSSNSGKDKVNQYVVGPLLHRQRGDGESLSSETREIQSSDNRSRSSSFRVEPLPRSRAHTLSQMAAAARRRRNAQEDKSRREKLRTRLIRILRMTHLMIKVCGQMKRASMRKTQAARSSELYFYNAGGTAVDMDSNNNIRGNNTQQLAFDKALFSRDKGSKLPLDVRLVANKPPHLRTERDLKLMHRVLNSMRSFKDRLTNNMKLTICQYASYLWCERGRVVLREGHHGESFYFIYNGSVFVQVGVTDPLTGESMSSVENVIHRGASFGELALLGNDGRRTATVVCREPTELFTVDKAAFDETFRDIFNMELKMKIGVARSLALFDGWSSPAVESLCFQSQLLNYPYGKVISLDWAQDQHVFYVAKGKVLLLRQVKPVPLKEAWNPQETCHKPLSAKLQSLPAYVSVGYLEEGDISDCRILCSSDPPYDLRSKMAAVIMISQGALLVRFSRMVIQNLAPASFLLQHYLQQQYTPRDIGSREAIYSVYLQTKAWTHYKANVMAERKRPQSAAPERNGRQKAQWK